MNMDIAIWIIREQARPLAQFIADKFTARIYHSVNGDNARNQFAATFPIHSHWIMIGASGVAVRYLTGLLADKRTDPSVIGVDEAANYVTVLVGGHEGGGNHLAYELSNFLNATAVITTATEATKPLILGIGCRKGTCSEAIETAALQALSGRPLTDVRIVATVHLKADEPGLKQFCQKYDLTIKWFPLDALRARPWVTESSVFVKERLGVSGVCEPCALMVSPRSRILVPKLKLNGVAVALATDTLELY